MRDTDQEDEWVCPRCGAVFNAHPKAADQRYREAHQRTGGCEIGRVARTMAAEGYALSGVSTSTLKASGVVMRKAPASYSVDTKFRGLSPIQEALRGAVPRYLDRWWAPIWALRLLYTVNPAPDPMSPPYKPRDVVTYYTTHTEELGALLAADALSLECSPVRSVWASTLPQGARQDYERFLAETTSYSDAACELIRNVIEELNRNKKGTGK